MPDLNDFADSLRADCDSPVLSPAAELRRAGTRRKVAYRTVGSLAVLVLIAGALAGFAILRGTPAPTLPAASHGQVIPDTTDVTTGPVTHTAPPTTGPTTVPTHSTSPTVTPSQTVTPTGTPACKPSGFHNPTVNPDDAAGITGYDITLTYSGSASCKQGQPARLYYTSGGSLVAFGVAAGAAGAKPIIVKHGHQAMFSIYEENHNGDPTPPPSCAKTHTYHGLVVKIGSGTLSLGSITLQFPCSGPMTTAWSTS